MQRHEVEHTVKVASTSRRDACKGQRQWDMGTKNPLALHWIMRNFWKNLIGKHCSCKRLKEPITDWWGQSAGITQTSHWWNWPLTITLALIISSPIFPFWGRFWQDLESSDSKLPHHLVLTLLMGQKQVSLMSSMGRDKNYFHADFFKARPTAH